MEHAWPSVSKADTNHSAIGMDPRFKGIYAL